MPSTGHSDLPSESDKILADLYRETSRLDVLGELYKRYMDLVYGVCLKYLKQREPARDAVMQIFEELVEKLKKHEVQNFKSWLHQVAKNYCLMQLRSPRRLKMVEMNVDYVQNDPERHLDVIIEREENFERMEKCIDLLPDVQRTVIQLFYLRGKCYNEIVIATGHEWKQIRSFIQNGRRNLKLCMEKRTNASNEMSS